MQLPGRPKMEKNIAYDLPGEGSMFLRMAGREGVETEDLTLKKEYRLAHTNGRGEQKIILAKAR